MKYLAVELNTNMVREGEKIYTHILRIRFLYSTQALTPLRLYENSIGAEGMRYLGNALLTNTVSEITPTFTLCVSGVFIQHRQSQACILKETVSVVKERNI